MRENFDYTIVFINNRSLASFDWRCIDRFFVGNVSQELTKCLTSLTSEAASPDNLFDLLAESWLVQIFAFLTRMTSQDIPKVRYRGGLTGADCRRVENYIRANLTGPITLSNLANLVNLGERHFSRVFSQTFFEAPIEYVIRLRVEKAKDLLLNTTLSVTDIASECGFIHAQHFSTRFHGAVGTSPSRYRHAIKL